MAECVIMTEELLVYALMIYRLDEYEFIRTFLVSFAKLIQSSQNSCQE